MKSRNEHSVSNKRSKTGETPVLKGSLKYFLPFFLYVFIPVIFEKVLFLSPYKDYAYVLKTLLVFFAVAYFFKQYSEIKNKFSWECLIYGMGIFVIWVGLEFILGKNLSSSFNPFSHDHPFFFIFFRGIGAVLVAPLVEELFVRSFLMRLIISNDWRNVEAGTFTWTSFLVTVVFFGVAHQRFLAGIIAGIAYNILLYRTKNITNTILAHSLTNLFLFFYVILTESWFFW